MTIDFSKPMTVYELLALILSVSALLYPLLKYFYNRFFRRIKIRFFPSGRMTIFFNKSGPYVSIGGVYEVKHKPAVIREVTAKIVRKTDQATLSLVWSTFSSPAVTKKAGGYETTFETAHPFKVDADTLGPAFIEFENTKEDIAKKIEEATSPVIWKSMNTMIPQGNYLAAIQEIRESSEAHDAFISISDEFFWKHSDYEIQLYTKYNNSVYTARYLFDLSEEDSKKLRSNINSIIEDNIVQRYGGNPIFYEVLVNFF